MPEPVPPAIPMRMVLMLRASRRLFFWENREKSIIQDEIQQPVFPIIIEGRFHESKEKYEIPVKSTRVYLTASIKIGIM